jgi:hypothetical protein
MAGVQIHAVPAAMPITVAGQHLRRLQPPGAGLMIVTAL